MPTLPFDQGCRAAHSIVSYPSSMSLRNGSHLPSDSCRPAHVLKDVTRSPGWQKTRAPRTRSDTVACCTACGIPAPDTCRG